MTEEIDDDRRFEPYGRGRCGRPSKPARQQSDRAELNEEPAQPHEIEDTPPAHTDGH